MSRSLTPAQRKRLEAIYKRWHWGEVATHVVETDPDMPPHQVEIGLLMELHVRPFGAKKPQVLAVTEGDVPNNHVGFDAEHRGQRIYFTLSDSTRRSGQELWSTSSEKSMTLAQAATQLGEGRHATKDYAQIRVKPLGHLTNLVYYTHKKGDGPSGYIHEMGEEGGVPPILCVSEDGRFWLAGGSYTCPNPGITR